ncbi:MAG: TonB-dependent receptor plug domain-containing protein [Gammaproteobacteria bacterium]|nr:TonB-dependent receptor plug domain-containing protein [Gammaproteobacteria bacterium]
MSAAIAHVLPFRRAVPSCTPARRMLPLAWLVGVVLAPLATAETASPEGLDIMVVTASPIARSLEELDQSVSLIGRDEIRGAAADNVADLLHFVSGVDVRQRGGRGVQADIGIRGTAFEQTLLMVDGVRMRDPQTGHHAMNLPVPMEHLERIEVLKGPGSAAYGPSATGGAINLITRRPDGFEAGPGSRRWRARLPVLRRSSGDGRRRQRSSAVGGAPGIRWPS